MADPKGFLTTTARSPRRRPVDVRIRDWNEVYDPGRCCRSSASRPAGAWTAASRSATTAARSGNLIPEWNDLVCREDWREAIERLHATNNFPEFTGRLCPAPCEAACVLGINQPRSRSRTSRSRSSTGPGTTGWVTPAAARAAAPARRSPSSARARPGLAAAQQLTRAGHTVAVYERADRIGGLLRYGIPEFKMEKRHLDRRIEQMRAEGTKFRTERRGRARRHRRRSCASGTTPSCSPSVPPPGATCRCPAASWPASTRPWSTCRSPTRCRRVTSTTPPITRRGQARRHHRRRRHRRRLPRHRPPAGRRLRHPAGDHAAAAGSARRSQPWPTWPMLYKVTSRARGGRRAGLRGHHHRVPRRRGRQRPCAAPGRGGVRATASSSRCRAPSGRSRPSWSLLAMGFAGTDRRTAWSSSSAWSWTSAATSPGTPTSNQRGRRLRRR